MASFIGNILIGVGSLATVVVILGAVSYAATGSFNPLDLFMNSPEPPGDMAIENNTDIMPSTVTIVTPTPTSTPTQTPTPTPTPPEEQFTMTMMVDPQRTHSDMGYWYIFHVQVLKGTSGVDGVDVTWSTSDNSILHPYLDYENFGTITTGHRPGSDVNGLATLGLLCGPNKGRVTVTATGRLNGKVVAETSMQMDVT